MDWPSVLQNVGMFGVASGLLVWLMKAVVGQALSRDLEAFKTKLQQTAAFELEEARNRFTIGATSHMADTAFDKHVVFCEEYIVVVNEAMDVLFRRGPHEDILEVEAKLLTVRTKWTLWLLPTVEMNLKKFEGALRTIGGNAWLIAQLRGDPDRESIKEAFTAFAAVMGWDKWKGEAVDRELAAERIIDGLRDTLGIAELSQLREELVRRALKVKVPNEANP
jgi:hypothetical protein